MLEEEQYRYQVALSDLAGSDIEAHGGNYVTETRTVRNWITTLGGFELIGASSVSAEYEDFRGWHFDNQRAAGFSLEDTADSPTAELTDVMTKWVSLGCLRNRLADADADVGRRDGRMAASPVLVPGVRVGAAVVPQKAESSSRIGGNRVPIQKDGNNRVVTIGSTQQDRRNREKTRQTTQNAAH